MNIKHSPLLILITLFTLLTAFGCGSPDSNPATPSTNAPDIGLMDLNSASSTDGTEVIGVYDLTFDPETETLDLVEARGADAHYDITAFIAPYTSAALISWDPTTGLLVFDLSVNNPTVVDVYDLRGLMLSPPGLGYELMNADDYTALFNPYATPAVHPFKAFGKTVPLRKFGGGDTFTEQYSIQFPLPLPTPLECKLLLEVSHPGNCEDPFEISNQVVSNPITSSISATITIDTFDHQNNVTAVAVDTSLFTGGLTWLTLVATDTWQGTVINSAGAPAGTYSVLMASLSLAGDPALFDYIEIEVGTGTIPTGVWSGTEYILTHGNCKLDLGVIADPGGPRDSEILMASDGVTNCDAVIKYDANYASWNYYVSTVTTLDPNVASYDAHPIERIDAADDGAFSFTNSNWSDLFTTTPSGPVYYAQVWNVLDNNPKLHTGPYPDDSRYWNDLNFDCYIYPIDVCDDFALGQHALFTSGYDFTPEDLTFLGVMPDTYTYDKVRYYGNLDPWAGIGTGLTNSMDIRGIDVIEGVEESPTHADVYDSATLYVLENNMDMFQVEVYRILDTVNAMAWDTVYYVMTINIDEYVNIDFSVEGKDIEILPINPHYELNPNDPTLCVLVSYFDWSGKIQGEVFLYNAVTGAFLETIGDIATGSALPHHMVQFLDTDDGDWEIHVTSINAAGNTVATIFSY